MKPLFTSIGNIQGSFRFPGAQKELLEGERDAFTKENVTEQRFPSYDPDLALTAMLYSFLKVKPVSYILWQNKCVTV